MHNVTFREALIVWLRIGVLSFGGPAGQIALMHRILVEEKKWLDEARFLHALNYCMLLPGPEAQQLATYVGWLLHGVKGGIVAGVLFILPGAAAIFVLSWLYVAFGEVSLVGGLFFGLKTAVLAIVLQALIRLGSRALNGTFKPILAALGFISLFVFSLPFPVVVLGAGLIGFGVARCSSPQEDGPVTSPDTEPTPVRAGTGRAALACLLLWVSTVGGLVLLLGQENVFSQIALFFSKMAMVTFGGAYAVLAYVAQQGVEHYQWLQAGEMLEGLGLAETTPGPLILVTQFVGFLAAYRDAATPGFGYAALGTALTLWVTFLPCFLWIFAGAPYIERLRANKALSAALAAITATVVGVIANLALWFAVNALFTEQQTIHGYGVKLELPVLKSLDPPSGILTAVALLMVFKLKWGIIPVLGVSAALGIGWILLSTPA